MGEACSPIKMIIVLLILLKVQGSLLQSVTCNETVCALRETSATLSCFYSHNNIQTVIWFSPKQKTKWRNKSHPEDLALDLDYAGRVQYTKITNTTADLRIRDLRESDSGEYQVMLITLDGQKYLSSTAVTLTITDLQVRTEHGILGQKGNQVNLTCNTTCTLTNSRWITWYKNLQRIKATSHTEPLVISSDDDGSYSCSIYHDKVIPSSALCISGKNCLKVTYTESRVCAVVGSSVDFSCTYSYPSDQRVNETFWSYNKNDMRLLKQFAGRMDYVGDKEKNCTLRLTNLTESDSGQYRFSFSTNDNQNVNQLYAVMLTVTDVQVQVSDAKVLDRQTVLSCSTSCTLPNNPTYLWYKNGRLVPNEYSSLYLYSSSYNPTDNYTCAVRAGSQDAWWTMMAVWGSVGVTVALFLCLITATLFIRRKRGREKETVTQSFHGPADDTYIPLNPNTMSEFYDTLGSVKASNPGTRTEYDNLSSEYKTTFTSSWKKRAAERDTHFQQSPNTEVNIYTSLNRRNMSNEYSALTATSLSHPPALNSETTSPNQHNLNEETTSSFVQQRRKSESMYGNI